MPLTDTQVRNAKGKEKPYKLGDGGWLFLLVNPDGHRYWRMSYRFAGKQKTLSLGVYPAVTLAEARKRRDEIKEQLANGTDPSEARRATKAAVALGTDRTFEVIAREWHTLKSSAWVASYSKLLLSRLEADVFPAIGRRPIADIEPPEILAAIRKVEARGALDLAGREMQAVGAVFRYAVATGRATRDPTQDLRGALKPAGRQQHHRAMPREELPDFLRAVAAYDGDPRTALALKLMLLTFVRTSELRAARWAEFEGLNGEEGVEPLWRIPPDRMKMRFEHLVPLSRQAVAVLRELRPLSGVSPYLFPSPSKEGVMSNNTMLYALYRLGWHGRATVHGFRGMASTWFNEAGYDRDWVERQLSHDERNKIRGAYNSAQYLAGRRQMMGDWADYIDRVAAGKPAAGKATPAVPVEN
ncbi:tyrosine-type recombinase/integrase [Xanthobacter flavus]|uniref:tyrosine-type recombinase/integrase n=1 Tax=Xanthobacter flavus TaxID=281 RepID=UPI00372B59FE